ncbi:hypothetical protein LguiB_009693 [Lonicera macranthoides]
MAEIEGLKKLKESLSLFFFSSLFFKLFSPLFGLNFWYWKKEDLFSFSFCFFYLSLYLSFSLPFFFVWEFL